ncbi:MAG: cytochrome P450 [Acidimicrobiales bacterium]
MTDPSPKFEIFRAATAPTLEQTDVLRYEGLTPDIRAGLGQLADAGIEAGSFAKILINVPGFSLAYAWHKSGYPLPLHSHDSDCCYVVIAGEMQVGKEVLGKGDGMLVPADTAYTFTTGPDGVEFLEYRHASSWNIVFKYRNADSWTKAATEARNRHDGWASEAQPYGLVEPVRWAGEEPPIASPITPGRTTIEAPDDGKAESMTSDMTLDEASRAFVESKRYTDADRWHQAAAVIRAEDPVHWVEHPDVYPFWVVTSHAEVMEVELHDEEFIAGPRGILGSREADDNRATHGTHRIKSLVVMDGKEHKDYRDLAASWFRPSNLRKMTGRLDQLTVEAMTKLEAAGGEIDFATDVAMEYPLQVILAMMGLPQSDYPRMLQLTQELFGPEDPEYARDAEDSLAGIDDTIRDFFSYFNSITEDRKARPTGDFCSIVANAEIDGEPIGVMEQLGLYIIAATAGHDTTSHAMTGGLQALIQHPDQLKKLQEQPELMPYAVDEMIRWTSPVKHFMRTATCDYELGGKTIKKGQDVLLAYWSANRDEAVFDDPFTFDVGRKTNRHVAFGVGTHF